ncbi:MAG: tetraacyldisaccharide 4'-kinase [Congregibacter sp.]
MSSLAAAVEKAWYGDASWTRLLLPLSCLYGLLVRVRRSAFERGWLRSESVGVPLVVVGNITAGGTGKTPVVIEVVKALQAAGLCVGVVSRGYGRQSPQLLRVDDESTSGGVGDEPLLIYRETGAIVVVCADRVAAARAAVGAGATVLVSDDGLQHYQLRRDVEIVCSDGKSGFGNGLLIPAGPLREPLQRLGSVDYFLQRGGSDPHSATQFRPKHFRHLVTGEIRELSAHGFTDEVHAEASIARPGRFFEELRNLGLDIREHANADHAALTAQSFAGFADETIIMTTKDAVKCEVLALPNAWALVMDLDLPEGFLQGVVEDCLQWRNGKQ